MGRVFLIFAFLLTPLYAQGNGSPYYETVGRKALAQVNCNWQGVLANWKINFLPGREDYLGMTNGSLRSIDIWVRQKASPSRVATIIVHELAHLVDIVSLTQAKRKEWYKLRGISEKTPWYPPRETKTEKIKSDYDTGAGDFAECMAWTLQGPNTKFMSKLGPTPNTAQQQVIHQWLADILMAGN
jgi:hypothetical protein